MPEQAVAPTHQAASDGSLAGSTSAEEATQRQAIFQLDVHPDNVALMVRYRNETNDATQIQVLASVESIRDARAPAGFVVDSVDVVGTRWDGLTPGGMRRVVCLLARTPDERSAVRFLIVVDQGDAIVIPPADSDIRTLDDFAIIYAHGEVILPP